MRGGGYKAENWHRANRCISRLVILVVLVTAFIGLTLDYSASSDVPAMVELTDLRTRESKTYQDTANTSNYRSDFFTDDIHYRADEWDADEPWKAIDENIALTLRPEWDYEVTRGKWQMYIRNDTTVACGRYGHWQRMRLEGVAYLDWATKNYVILDTRSDNVTPTVDGNTVRWAGIFNNVDLEYIYTASNFRAVLTLSEAGRAWARNNPPSKYGLSNQTSYLTFYATVDYAQAYDAVDDEGDTVDWNKAQEYESDGVSFIHPTKNVVIARLLPNEAYVEDEYVTQHVPILKRYIKKGANNYLLFGAKVTKLNNLPAGAIIFDPDTYYPDPDPESVSCDGYAYEIVDNTPWTTLLDGEGGAANDSSATNHIAYFSMRTTDWRFIVRGLLLFDTSGLDDDAVITATTLSVYGKTKVDQNSAAADCDANVYSSAPASNTEIVAGDYNSLGSTPFCDTAITYADFSLESYNDFVFNAAGKDSINLVGVSKYGFRMPYYDVERNEPNQGGSDAVTQMNIYSADEATTAKDPKLVVTWSPPEPPPEATLFPPLNLNVVDLGVNTVNITWSHAENVTSAYIMMGRAPDFASSVNQTGFELIYHGGDSETTVGGLALTTTNYTFSAWGDNTTDLSDGYTTATIGGDDMENIATGINAGVVAFLILGLTTVGLLARVKLLVIIAGFGVCSYGFTLLPDYAWYLASMVILFGAALVGLGAIMSGRRQK